VIQATKIQWKDESKNLTKLYPLQFDEDDGETLAEQGSFFNFFEVARDYHDVSFVWVPMRSNASAKCMNSLVW
jgi:template-activating factor I